ncbi:MAG: hypothetical protein RLZZ453_318 [Chlamydiota bacterium]|jgi:hypothetical protein
MTLPICYSKEALWSNTPPEMIKAPLVERIKEVVLFVLSVVIFPMGIYRCLHSVYSYWLFPACYKNRNDVLRFAENWPLDTLMMRDFLFSTVILQKLAKFRLFQRVARLFLGRDRSLDSYFSIGRMGFSGLDILFLKNRKKCDAILLYCCGEHELAEGKIYDVELRSLAKKVNAHILLFNYPGFGASQGSKGRSNMIAAYRKVLGLAEKQLGAKLVISYGASIGASIALEGLNGYKSNIRHVLVMRSPYIFGALSSWLGWGCSYLKTLRSLSYPYLLLETAAVPLYQPVQRPSQIIPDPALEYPEYSVAYRLLERGGDCVRGVVERQEEPLSQSLHSLASEINRAL